MCVPLCGRWCGWRGRAVRRTPARRTSRYISQPRQKPKTALSRAATSANPVATWPTSGGAGQEADQPDHARTPGPPPGRTAAAPGPPARVGGPSRGRTSVRNSHAYGVGWTPRTAPTANTTGLHAPAARVASRPGRAAAPRRGRPTVRAGGEPAGRAGRCRRGARAPSTRLGCGVPLDGRAEDWTARPGPAPGRSARDRRGSRDSGLVARSSRTFDTAPSACGSGPPRGAWSAWSRT